MHLDSEIIKDIQDFNESDSFIRSANYGYNAIDKHISGLKENSIILEVGGGALILSAQLSKKYPLLKFITIEPHSPGFEKFNNLSRFLVKKYNLNVHFGEYKTFQLPDHKKFDLIFSVDVLEHLDEYELFLSWCKKHLKNTGQLVTVFPNFGFPFDYHFRIPLLINKKITGYFFKQKIARDELKNNCKGLWNSLNFITVKKLKLTLKNLGFEVTTSTLAYDYMCGQLLTDDGIIKRNNFIARIAKIAQFIGVLRIFRTKALRNWIPFAIIEAKFREV
jgi:SAM-dependent methyltransferase